jgi:RNA polymerase sigma-70 factor (ECF subfamily)
MVGNVEDAQDIYQESLVAAYVALPRFRLKSEFSTWLYRIVVNKSVNFRRTTANWSSHASEEQAGRILYHTRTPERKFLDSELKDQVGTALDTLSRHKRMAWTLCHHRDLKIRQAADWMQCSSGAVKSYLFRAREKLKKSLKAYLQEDRRHG